MPLFAELGEIAGQQGDEPDSPAAAAVAAEAAAARRERRAAAAAAAAAAGAGLPDYNMFPHGEPVYPCTLTASSCLAEPRPAPPWVALVP